MKNLINNYKRDKSYIIYAKFVFLLKIMIQAFQLVWVQRIQDSKNQFILTCPHVLFMLRHLQSGFIRQGIINLNINNKRSILVHKHSTNIKIKLFHIFQPVLSGVISVFCYPRQELETLLPPYYYHVYLIKISFLSYFTAPNISMS